MKRNVVCLIAALLAATLLVVGCVRIRPARRPILVPARPVVPREPPVPRWPVVPREPPVPRWPVVPVQPVWDIEKVPVAPLKESKVGSPVLDDVESHLWRGHPYKDRDSVTWVHEGTHGIHSRIRNTHGRPGFYLLEDQGVLTREPPVTLTDVAQAVPRALRGPNYDLYLRQQARKYELLRKRGELPPVQQWKYQPTYILDEWVAYTNGALEAHVAGRPDRRDAGQTALEFTGYAVTLAAVCPPADTWGGDFIPYHAQRCHEITLLLGLSGYCEPLRQSPEAARLRQFAQAQWGKPFCQQVLGF